MGPLREYVEYSAQSLLQIGREMPGRLGVCTQVAKTGFGVIF